MKIGILAIQGDYEAHQRRVSALGANASLVRTPAELSGLVGLIIPGGESTTILNFLERDGFFDKLREFVHSKPTFGTCAGAILLATKVENPSQISLGAIEMTVRRNAYGRQNESSIHEAQTELPGGMLEMVFIRAPKISRVGNGVQVLALRDGDPVLVRQGKTMAATFHPELSDDNRVHEAFLDLARG